MVSLSPADGATRSSLASNGSGSGNHGSQPIGEVIADLYHGSQDLTHLTGSLDSELGDLESSQRSRAPGALPRLPVLADPPAPAKRQARISKRATDEASADTPSAKQHQVDLRTMSTPATASMHSEGTDRLAGDKVPYPAADPEPVSTPGAGGGHGVGGGGGSSGVRVTGPAHDGTATNRDSTPEGNSWIMPQPRSARTARNEGLHPGAVPAPREGKTEAGSAAHNERRGESAAHNERRGESGADNPARFGAALSPPGAGLA